MKTGYFSHMQHPHSVVIFIYCEWSKRKTEDESSLDFTLGLEESLDNI